MDQPAAWQGLARSAAWADQGRRPTREEFAMAPPGQSGSLPSQSMTRTSQAHPKTARATMGSTGPEPVSPAKDGVKTSQGQPGRKDQSGPARATQGRGQTYRTQSQSRGYATPANLGPNRARSIYKITTEQDDRRRSSGLSSLSKPCLSRHRGQPS